MSSMSVQSMTPDQIHASRAEQRKQRLLEAEMEIAMEEAEALRLTEDQRQTLLRPFATVKAEFTDLDGLRWTQAALCMLSPQSPQHHPPPHVPPNTPADVLNVKRGTAFNVLTKADLDSFAPEDTIRPSFSSSSSLADLGLPNAVVSRHRDGSHSRSPIKGLFTRQLDVDDPSETSTKVHTLNSSPSHLLSTLQLAVELDEEDASGFPVPPGLESTPAPTPYSSPDPAAQERPHLSSSQPSSPTQSLLELPSTTSILHSNSTSRPSLGIKNKLSSPRSRLRLLLHDDRSSVASTPIHSTLALPTINLTSAPASPSVSQSSRRASLQRCSSRLDLTSLCFYDDDDQTPTPSPIASRRPDLY